MIVPNRHEQDRPYEGDIKSKFTPHELSRLRRQREEFEATGGLEEVFGRRGYGHLKFTQWLVREGRLTP